jgi:antibiotic biosynthesis monooxygenase (ABM) superfamily enzyme
VSMKRSAQIETTRERLQTYLAEEREDTMLAALRHWIEDPLKPRTKNGSFRLNPILLLLAVLIMFSAGTFLLFTFGHS